MKKTLLIFLIIANGSPLATDRAAFLRQGFGAKGKVLGKGFGSTVKDPSALYFNPAGLAHINGELKSVQKINPAEEAEKAFDDPAFTELENEENTEVKPNTENKPAETIEKTFEIQLYATAGQMSLDQQVGFAAVGFTLPYGTMGVGALYSGVDGIDGFDEAGASTGATEYMGYAGYLGYAFETKSDLKLGFSLMGAQEDIGGSTLNAGSLNVGAQKTIFFILLAEVGVNVQNLAGVTEQTTFNDSTYEKLDTIINVSLSLAPPPPNANAKLIVGFDANVDDPEDGLSGSIGIALAVTRYSYIMAGYNNGGLAAGLGIKFKMIDVAYAVNRDSLGLGFQHFAELNLRF